MEIDDFISQNKNAARAMQARKKYDALMQSKAPDYLAVAVLMTLFVFVPTGAVAIIYAAKANELSADGDYDEARRRARIALRWIVASPFCAFIFVCAGFCFLL